MRTNETQRFTAAYEDCYLGVLRYVQRRVDTGAEDVVAEAMTTAWRRVDELPRDADGARAWLYGIARNTLLNHRRGARRQAALGVRLADAAGTTALATLPDAADATAARLDLRRAWDRLDDTEQEVIALTALDGLTSAQAGDVLGISATAYRHRLSRARATLRTHLTPAPQESTC